MEPVVGGRQWRVLHDDIVMNHLLSMSLLGTCCIRTKALQALCGVKTSGGNSGRNRHVVQSESPPILAVALKRACRRCVGEQRLVVLR